MQNIRKNYTDESKAKVVKEILKEEKTLSQIASAYETHVNVISRWRDQALAVLPGIFNEQPVQELVAKEAAWEKERTTMIGFTCCISFLALISCALYNKHLV
jgi:transposase-like protein